MDSLPHSGLLRKIQLVELHRMPNVLYPGKLYCLGPDEGSPPRLGVPGRVAVVPISSWKWWKELVKQDGLKGPVVFGPAKCAWRCGYVPHMLPVDKEAVIAVVRVVNVDKACEKPDIGVPFLRAHNCAETVLRRQETPARSMRCSGCKWQLRSMTPWDGVIEQELFRTGRCAELEDRSLGGPGVQDNKLSQSSAMPCSGWQNRIRDGEVGV